MDFLIIISLNPALRGKALIGCVMELHSQLIILQKFVKKEKNDKVVASAGPLELSFVTLIQLVLLIVNE